MQRNSPQFWKLIQIVQKIEPLPIKEAVYKAIYYINESDLKSIMSRPHTITSFLKGAEQSPFFGSIFVKHLDVCGTWPDIKVAEVISVIEALIREGKIESKDHNYYAIENANQIFETIDNIFLFRNESKIFTDIDLLELSDWIRNFNTTRDPKYIKTIDGWDFPYDSKEEFSLIRKLSKKEYYKVLRGQSLIIPYDTSEKLNKDYHPDIVMLTHDNRIAIIEVKPLNLMSNYYNICKYEGLKKYAKDNGFICVMCDRNFRTFEYLSRKKVPKAVADAFENQLHIYNKFTPFQLDNICEGMTRKQKEAIKLDIHAYIIQKGYRNNSRYSFDINKE